jgi:hypothetical protein
MIVNNELERTWKEVVGHEYKVLTWHLPIGTEEYHRNLS